MNNCESQIQEKNIPKNKIIKNKVITRRRGNKNSLSDNLDNNKYSFDLLKSNNTNRNKLEKCENTGSKVLIQKKNDNKFGQIMGPEVDLKRSKSIIKKSTKKDKNKDCII